MDRRLGVSWGLIFGVLVVLGSCTAGEGLSEAAIPVLLRVPEGIVYRAEGVVREGVLRRYSFSVVSEGDMGPLPWIEVHYPHTEQRIMLDAEGTWGEVAD